MRKPESVPGVAQVVIYTALAQFWPTDGTVPPLNALRPWAEANVTSALHQQIAPGIEPTFIEWARKDGKPSAYLESPDAYPTLADAVPLAAVERTLAALLADPTVPPKSLMAMCDSGSAGTYQPSDRSSSHRR
jgi:hypothetical protein